MTKKIDLEDIKTNVIVRTASTQILRALHDADILSGSTHAPNVPLTSTILGTTIGAFLEVIGADEEASAGFFRDIGLSADFIRKLSRGVRP